MTPSARACTPVRHDQTSAIAVSTPPATHSSHHRPTSRDGCGRRSGARSSAPCSISASTGPATARFHPGTTHPSTISRHDRDGSELLRAAAAAAAGSDQPTTTPPAARPSNTVPVPAASTSASDAATASADSAPSRLASSST